MQIRLECKDITYAEIVLFWSVEPEVKETVSHFGYIAQISESEDGPWISLYDDPIYAFGYVDKTTQRGMVDQRLYYRIMGVDLNSHIFYSNPVCLFNEEGNNLTNYISEVESLMLRRYNGQDCLHFARKKFGDRCEICYDIVLKKSISPKCRSCFGTTFKNGYFAPVKILVNFNPQAKQTDKTDYGVNEQMGLSGWTSNKSIIESDDILIFLKKPSERYLINSITPTSLNGNTVRQILNLTQLKADHPGQLLNVNMSAYTLDEFSIFRRDWKQS